MIWLLGVKAGLLAWWRPGERRRCGPLATWSVLICGLLALAAAAASEVANYLGDPRLSVAVDPERSAELARWARPEASIPAASSGCATPTPRPGTGPAGHWWDDDTGINQAAVDRMISRTLRAWPERARRPGVGRIFRHFNTTHGRGSVGYQAGEKIAIKINCNNTYRLRRRGQQRGRVAAIGARACLRQLVNQAGVAQSNITVYEAPKTAPSRVIPDRIFNKCHAEFPNVILRRLHRHERPTR